MSRETMDPEPLSDGRLFDQRVICSHRLSKKWNKCLWLSVLCLSFWSCEAQVQYDGRYDDVESLLNKTFSGSDAKDTYERHTSNWAVLVGTSRFWFNYRHVANTLSLYRSIKNFGIPDNQIILMLADDMACNPRNSRPGEVFDNAKKELNLYGTDIEVDYRGPEVTVENFLRILTGRHLPGTPAAKKLNTDDRSNIFVYMTGHGGDEFLKFQDNEEICSQDIADAINEMYLKGRYHELLLMVDTCQAGTLFNALNSPNVIAVGSSMREENSYSHHGDVEIGVSVIDRFTYATLKFFESIRKKGEDVWEKTTLSDLFSSYNPKALLSTPDIRDHLFRYRKLSEIPLSDFFGSVVEVEAEAESNARPTLFPRAVESRDDSIQRAWKSGKSSQTLQTDDTGESDRVDEFDGDTEQLGERTTVGAKEAPESNVGTEKASKNDVGAEKEAKFSVALSDVFPGRHNPISQGQKTEGNNKAVVDTKDDLRILYAGTALLLLLCTLMFTTL